MKKNLLTIIIALIATVSQSQNLSWNFTTDTIAVSTIPNISSSGFSRGNNNGTTALLSTTSASTGYTGSSGTNNIGAATRTGALNIAANGSAYFEITLTPASGYTLIINGLSFGSRSTGTGPRNYTLLTSKDSFATNAITPDTLLANSTWALRTAVFPSNIVSAVPITLRIYGYNGVGNPASGTANWRLDDITFIGSATTGTVSTGPSSVSNLTLTGITKYTATVNFNKSINYNAANTNVVVFIKKDAPIVTGTPTKSIANYVASTNLASLGSTFQNDSLATCILNGDTNLINLTGLVSGSTYYLLAYVVTNADSLYSNPSIANGQSSARPIAMNTVTFVSNGTNAAAISLSPIPNYNPTIHTKLVFLKKDTNIIQGTPSIPATDYIADADWNAASIKYQNDSLAKCVMNSDADSVYVTGLTTGSTYHLLVYVYRNDTTYSLPKITNGKTDGATTLPLPVSAANFSAIGTSSLTLNWTKPANYVDSVNTTLVFVKAGTSITTAGQNTRLASAYIGNGIFKNGSTYQLDSNAYCILNADSAKATVNGLNPETNYFFVIYNVRNDSIYSTAVFSLRATNSLQPDPATNVLVTGTSQNTARISWTKPTGYVNVNMSTLVFIKRGTIVPTTLTKASNKYTASTNFGTGTKYDSDTLAFCVFRADTNFVAITNLIEGATYSAVVHIVKDADSNVSIGAAGSGSTFGPAQVYLISQINKTNPTTGNPDSLNVKVTVRGIVYGFNHRSTGLQMQLHDAGNGITLFNNSKNFGYSVKEGDSILVTGNITTARGLVQITMDTLVRIDSNKTLRPSALVTALSENTENKLITLRNVSFIIPPSGTNWPATSTNYQLKTELGDTVILRHYSTSPLAGTPVPASEKFSVTGLGGQSSSSFNAPFLFNGYQIIPRNVLDIVSVGDTLSAFDLTSPVDLDTITITNANINDTILLNWENSLPMTGLAIPTYEFQLDTLGGDFQFPVAAIESSENLLKITGDDILTLLLDLGVQKGQLFAGEWRIKATTGTFERYSTSTNRIFLRNESTNGIGELIESSFIVYPNPINRSLTIKGDDIESVELYSIQGVLLNSATGSHLSEIQLDTESLVTGVYFINIKTPNGSISKKIIKQ